MLMDSPPKREQRRFERPVRPGNPLSMPVSVIRELVENFDLDLLRRNAKMDMTGEVMDREILVLRGDLETVKAAEKYMFEALDRKFEEWKRRIKRKIQEVLRGTSQGEAQRAEREPKSCEQLGPDYDTMRSQSIITHLFFPSQSFSETSFIFVAASSSTSRSQIHWAIFSAVGFGRRSLRQR